MTAALWIKHRPLARKLAKGYYWPGADRQDVEQEALIALWEATRTWDQDKGAFTSYAHRCIQARLTDRLRVATNGKRFAGPLADVDIATLPHLHQVSDRVETTADLRDLVARINALPRSQRNAVVGVAAGMSYAEIGDPKAVDNALYRARKKLSLPSTAYHS